MKDIKPKEPFELFGVECGDGWNEVLKPIFKYIEEYNQDKPESEHLIPLQIKEKWSELCVYMNFETPELTKLIETAEKEARNTCEICGSKDDVGMTMEGWLTKKCHQCVKEHAIKYGRPCRWKRNSDNTVYWVHADKDDEVFANKKFVEQ